MFFPLLLLFYFFSFSSFSLLFVIFSFTAHRLQQGLQEYAEYVMERTRLEDLMAVNDPRSEEEKILAADLLSTAISQRPEPIESGEDVFCCCISFPFLLFLWNYHCISRFKTDLCINKVFARLVGCSLGGECLDVFPALNCAWQIL